MFDPEKLKRFAHLLSLNEIEATLVLCCVDIDIDEAIKKAERVARLYETSTEEEIKYIADFIGHSAEEVNESAKICANMYSTIEKVLEKARKEGEEDAAISAINKVFADNFTNFLNFKLVVEKV